MNKSAVIHARIEPGIKRSAESILNRIGLSSTEAIRMFYRQITLRKGLPFAVELPNATTRATLQASRAGKDVEEFASTEELFASWDK
ncbi:MAG: type II toxin-antitoxin system RelB/DinJ family antitoxin [Verrucomicrobia bacterium]|nr:MAG: type II toxin-antitoxin system RelB/DinJ family antitoxin [Verrucomicrobiota bacterium]